MIHESVLMDRNGQVEGKLMNGSKRVGTVGLKYLDPDIKDDDYERYTDRQSQSSEGQEQKLQALAGQL
jgi:hypothetical protein